MISNKQRKEKSMSKKINKSYDKFLELLLSLNKKEKKWRWARQKYTDDSRVLEYWKTLSNKAKTAIVGDSRWNHYPIWTYSSTDAKKGFGEVFENLVAALCYSQTDRKILVNHSKGIFAIHVLDTVSSEERIKMSRRLINSKDSRVRGRVVNILPIASAKKMMRNRSLRSMPRNIQTKLVARIGFDNCYKDFIPENISKRPWGLERRALRLATKKDLNSLIAKVKSGTYAPNNLIIEEIVKKLSPDEVIFFLGDIGDNERAAKIAATILDLSK